MLAQGLVEEVRRLRRDYPNLCADHPAMRAVGYRQVWQYLDGELSAVEMRERGIIATRQLARRQLTWLRHWPDLVGLDPDIPGWQEEALARVRKFLYEE
jgi:tRNA dimethylallyltransferase